MLTAGQSTAGLGKHGGRSVEAFGPSGGIGRDEVDQGESGAGAEVEEVFAVIDLKPSASQGPCRAR